MFLGWFWLKNSSFSVKTTPDTYLENKYACSSFSKSQVEYQSFHISKVKIIQDISKYNENKYAMTQCEWEQIRADPVLMRTNTRWPSVNENKYAMTQCEWEQIRADPVWMRTFTRWPSVNENKYAMTQFQIEQIRADPIS